MRKDAFHQAIKLYNEGLEEVCTEWRGVEARWRVLKVCLCAAALLVQIQPAPPIPCMLCSTWLEFDAPVDWNREIGIMKSES